MNWAYSGRGSGRRRVGQAVHRALDLGMTLLDTADMYGVHQRALVGAGVEGTAAGRVRGRPRSACWSANSTSRPTAAPAARNAPATPRCAASRLEVIDLYQLHRADPEVPVGEETWGAMADLVQAGKVRALGMRGRPAPARRPWGAAA
ncbi:aldo/keto reductase [Streptomyces sp. L7]